MSYVQYDRSEVNRSESETLLPKKRLPSEMQGQEVCELEMANFTYKFLKIRGEIRADACNSKNVMVLATKLCRVDTL